MSHDDKRDEALDWSLPARLRRIAQVFGDAIHFEAANRIEELEKQREQKPTQESADAFMVLASGKGGELAVTLWVRLSDAQQDAHEWRINGKETEIVPLFQKAASAPSSTAPKPRGTYVPLTEEEIERRRGQLLDAHKEPWASGTRRAVNALCDMAISSLLYVEEIQRLRDTPLSATGPSTLDTAERVCFYEQEFYVLSNFSSFKVEVFGIVFATSEHAYHWAKFDGRPSHHQNYIRAARSAHDAFKYAERHKADRRPDWDAIKVDVMRDILRAKVQMHEYVRRKLLETGERELVENSWRDDFWGCGQNRDGKNMLGKLWMEVRAELRRADGRDQT